VGKIIETYFLLLKMFLSFFLSPNTMDAIESFHAACKREEVGSMKNMGGVKLRAILLFTTMSKKRIVRLLLLFTDFRGDSLCLLNTQQCNAAQCLKRTKMRGGRIFAKSEQIGKQGITKKKINGSGRK
jgi:hypothetical protein